MSQHGREDHVMGEKQIVYDRTPDMKIKLQDGRVVTLGEMEPMVAIAGKLFAWPAYRLKAWRCSISNPGFRIGGHRENRRRWI